MSQALEQDILCPDCGDTFTLDYEAEDTEADCPECGCIIVLTIDPVTSKVTKVDAGEDDEDEDEDDDETEIEAVDDEEEDEGDSE